MAKWLFISSVIDSIFGISVLSIRDCIVAELSRYPIEWKKNFTLYKKLDHGLLHNTAGYVAFRGKN